MIVAGGSVQTEVTKESVIEVLSEFDGVKLSRPVTTEELVSSQEGLLKGYPSGFERPGQILGKLIQLVTNDMSDDYFQTLPAKFGNVTLQNVHDVGLSRINTEEMIVLVVGDRNKIEQGLRELDLPVVILEMD